MHCKSGASRNPILDVQTFNGITMALVAKFTFNPFQENTYVVYDDTKECAIFDPGCYTTVEQEELSNFLEAEGLKPVRLINTHCHIDHVFGNKYIAGRYQLGLEIHEGALPVLKAVPQIAHLYVIALPDESPMPSGFLKEHQTVEFGNTTLKVLYTPGHSPASISFYCAEDNFLIAGDVLFKGSIGRTDLPGGNFDTLIESIKSRFLSLDGQTIVYPGHGPATTIAVEKASNPLLQA